VERSQEKRTSNNGDPRKRSFSRAFGTAEGVLALCCLGWVMMSSSTPASRFDVPWGLIVVWASGLGLGVGALRFGGRVGRLAGCIAVTFLGALLLIFVFIYVSSFMRI